MRLDPQLEALLDNLLTKLQSFGALLFPCSPIQPPPGSFLASNYS